MCGQLNPMLSPSSAAPHPSVQVLILLGVVAAIPLWGGILILWLVLHLLGVLRRPRRGEFAAGLDGLARPLWIAAPPDRHDWFQPLERTVHTHARATGSAESCSLAG